MLIETSDKDMSDYGISDWRMSLDGGESYTCTLIRLANVADWLGTQSERLTEEFSCR